MIRKTTAAVVLAGALALGTASATSLGDFDDVSFAASGVALQDCTITTDTLALLPEIPSAGTAVGDLADSTFLLDALDLSMLEETEANGGLPDTCTGDLAEVLLIGGGEVLETLQVTVDSTDGDDLTSVALTGDFDVSIVSEVRIVVRNSNA